MELLLALLLYIFIQIQNMDERNGLHAANLSFRVIADLFYART